MSIYDQDWSDYQPPENPFANNGYQNGPSGAIGLNNWGNSNNNYGGYNGISGGPPTSGSGAFGGGGQPMGEYYDLINNQAQQNNGLPEGWSDLGNGTMSQMRGQTMANPFGGSTYIRNVPSNQGSMSGSDEFQGVGMSDYMNLVAAQEGNWNNRNNANQAFLDNVLAGGAEMRKAGEDAMGQMSGVAGDLTQTGADMYSEREAELDKGIESFVSTSAAQNASMAAGDLMKNRSAVNQMAAGAKMGNPVDIAALSQFRMDSDAQTSQRMTSLASQYNQNLAGLHMNKAGTMNQAAGVRSSYDNQASNIHQAGIQMNAAAHAQAANHEANGLSGYANMISNNPWTPVAFLPTLMSFFQFSQTTGSDNWGGMDDSVYSGITDSNNY